MNWLVFVHHCPCINFNLTIDIFVSSVFECETFVFQTGYSRPLFRHFESLVSEATVLPIAPQPLPNFCYIQSTFFIFGKDCCWDRIRVPPMTVAIDSQA